MLEDIGTEDRINACIKILDWFRFDIPEMSPLQIRMVSILIFNRLEIAFINIGHNHLPMIQQKTCEITNSTANLQDISSQVWSDFLKNPSMVCNSFFQEG